MATVGVVNQFVGQCLREARDNFVGIAAVGEGAPCLLKFGQLRILGIFAELPQQVPALMGASFMDVSPGSLIDENLRRIGGR